MVGDKSIDDCVLQSEVAGKMEEIKAMFKDHSNVMNHTLESIKRRVSTLIERMDDFEKHLPVARDGDTSINNDDDNNHGGASDEEDDDGDDEQHAEREHAA
jgi:lipoate synthase